MVFRSSFHIKSRTIVLTFGGLSYYDKGGFERLFKVESPVDELA